MVKMRAFLVFGAGLALRLVLIARFPLIFGGDPMLRMLHRDQILLSHQLPLLQAIVYLIARVTHAYVVTQGVMAIIGAAASVGFYLLARDLVEESAAFLAALLLTTNPFIAAFSIVPFQESLMLAMLFFAFHYFYTDKPVWASFFLALACFTRFEAWAAAPVLAAAYIWKRGIKPSVVLRGLALFGWAPMAWIVFQRGLAPAGSYVVEAHVTAMRLIRWVYLGYITLKFTPVIVIALGSFGCWLLWRDRRQWLSRVWPLAVFFGLFLLALLFSAHGDWPDPERRVASREAHLWIAAVVMLAAIALGKLPRYRAALTAVGVLFGIWGSYRYVQREAEDPHLLLSYRLAKFLDTALEPSQHALILAPPWPSHTFDFYLQQARETGGEAGYQAAVRNLAESDQSPPAYQRTLIHSRFDRDRLLWKEDQCTEWVAIWSDYSTPQPDSSPPETILHAGDLSVAIRRLNCAHK
jgi:hypothetical protein